MSPSWPVNVTPCTSISPPGWIAFHAAENSDAEVTTTVRRGENAGRSEASHPVNEREPPVGVGLGGGGGGVVVPPEVGVGVASTGAVVTVAVIADVPVAVPPALDAFTSTRSALSTS